MKQLFPSDKQEQKDTKGNRRFWKDSLADGAGGVTLDRSVLARLVARLNVRSQLFRQSEEGKKESGWHL
jgi:hypothetical protein